MKKNEKLAVNTMLFAINSFGSRIIVFLLVPLYAHYMSKSSYGVADLIYSTASLLLTVFSLKVSAAILRFVTERGEDNQSVLSNSAAIILLSSIVVLIITIILVPVLNLSAFYYYMPILYLTIGIKDITAQFCKASGKTKVYAVEGAISSSSLLLFDILFIIVLKMDVNGYLISVLLSNFVALLYLVKVGRIRYRLGGDFSSSLLKEMLSYSIPLVPNSFSWWIIQMSDRYMVAWIISQAANGIYTMAYKIPSMMGVVSDVFMQAWVLSAISEYDGDKDYSHFRSVYASFEGLLFFTSSLVICLNKPIALLLFGKEFIDASVYSPLLIFALIFNNIQAFFGSFYNAAKKTKELLYSSVSAAVLNIVLNCILIPVIGVYGAIISTCLSYFLLAVLRIMGSRQYVRFEINLYIFIGNVVALFSQALNEAFNTNRVISISIDVVLLIIISCINYKRLQGLLNMFISMLNRFIGRHKESI